MEFIHPRPKHLFLLNKSPWKHKKDILPILFIPDKPLILSILCPNQIFLHSTKANNEKLVCP